MEIWLIVVLSVLGFFGLWLLGGFRVALEYERLVIFRLGRYKRTIGPGFVFIIPIIETAKRTAALEREFRRLLDHRVRVRSVIAVPGWQVHEQSSEEHLIVNDRSLPMLRGWKDQADYLMNEDVDALHRMLTSLTKAST